MSGAPLPSAPAGVMPSAVPLSVADRFREWRNRLIGSAAFRRFAARNPLTRAVARRQTAALFDLAAGFVYAQILSAFVRLRLVDLLAGGPKTAAEAAAAAGLPAIRMERLLRAAVALDLAERRSGGRYGLGMRGAALVGNDGVRAMIEHHRLLYADLADPVALLRGEAAPRLGGFWAYEVDADPEAAQAYSRLMAASQAMLVDEILDALPLTGATHLLDVGGGTGAFAEAVARRNSRLSVTLFDLPPVADLARRRLERGGLSGRVRVAAGSFHDDALPTGADMVTLVRVLHDHDDAPALALLRAIRNALPSGGRLAIAEPMADTPGARPAGDAYFGFYLLAMGRGRPRRFDEIAAMAREAGFGRVHEVRTPTPLLVRIAVATA